MKKQNVFVKSAVALAMVGAFGGASAATIGGTPIDFALETCQPTTVFTLPLVTYTAGVAAIQDFYVTFTLTNGTFVVTPAAVVTNVAAGGTATLVAGGANNASVTFRIDASASAWAAGDSVALTAGATAKVASCSAPIVVSAANGLLFISGAVASPLEAVAAVDLDGVEEIATFTKAVTITMNETGSDPIDLNPTPSSNSRKVFGPTTALDIATANSWAESTTMITRELLVTIGAQVNPDGSAFTNALDSLAISLGSPFDTSSITALCVDADGSGTCTAGESFNLTTGVAVLAPTVWPGAAKGGFMLVNDGTVFAPRTLTLNYSLAVATAASRPGMTAHTYTYAAPGNNTWPIQYANGTLLRSQWFLSDLINNSTLRLVNASSAVAAVVDATFHLDSGATAQIVGLTSVPAMSGLNTQLNATSVPGLSTGPASRGYIEVTIAGDLINVEGSMITYNTGTNDRTTAAMRNITIDSGNRGAISGGARAGY